MVSKLPIQSATVERMRCKNCKNCLSIFPVYLMGDDGPICGRCTNAKSDVAIRDEAYEFLAQFVSFPCGHKENGCKEMHLPSELVEHEAHCEFKKFQCPIRHYTKCDWTGASQNLEEHFKKDHPGQIAVNGTFKVCFATSQRETLLLSAEKSVFIVTKEIDARKNTLWCSVNNIILDDSQNKFNYRLILETDNRNYSHKFPFQPTTTTTKDNTTKVNEEYIKEQLGNPSSMVARIEISKTNNVQVPVQEAQVSNPAVDLDILSELECPVCMDYMLPPIYQCLEGHSLCKACKVQLKGVCPLCKKAIQDTQNYALEKLTAHLVYPCKYHKNGCQFTSKSDKIPAHEQLCSYGPFECPLKDFTNCDWKDKVAEVEGHLEKQHLDYFSRQERLNVPWKDPTQKIEQCWLIRHEDDVFKMHFSYENERFRWSVQFLGPPENFVGYQFEIDFVDQSGNNLRHFLRQKCVPLVSKEDCFKKSGGYAVMFLEQLEPFITTMFSFKVRIYKN